MELAQQPTKPDPRPHRTAFRHVNALAHALRGDVVLVPDPNNLDGLTRNDLIKISHWAAKGDDGEHLLTEANADCLGILTDSFFRFIDEGQDASVVTLWRGGTPAVQQIDGEPCGAAVELVFDALASGDELREKWQGLPPLEAEIEILAYRNGFPAGHRPAWLERKARENLVERDVDPDQPKEAPAAANDNQPHHDRLIPYLAAFGGPDAQLANGAVYGAVVDGQAGQIRILDDGKALFAGRLSSKLIELPARRTPIAATPFALGDPASIPEREWLYGRHYIRRYVTASVGPGGGGKTAHSISEALAMVTGRPLLDPNGPLTKPLRVWWINAEDPQEEIDRRFHAAAKHFGVTNEQINGRLFTDSGRDQQFVIARQEGRDLKLVEPFINEMVAEIRRREVDIVIIDPFVSTHEAPENDNGAMQRVAAAWTRVTDDANCNIELVHHVAKNQGEVTADSARGGGAFKDKVRSMRVFNSMTKEEAEKAGLDNHHGYFRVDFGKVNMIASGKSQWRRFVSVPLGNGKGLVKTGDEIGVVEAWRWPSKSEVTAFVTPEELHALKRKIDGCNCRDSVQSTEWAGYKVAEALQLNMSIPEEKRKVRRMLDAWKEAGHFTIEQRPDYKGVDRPCLVPIFHTSEI